jgi:cytochrome c oxidase assembly protein subunit 15
MAKIVLSVLLVQLLLGVGNIVLDFPLAVAVAHNLGGALLLLTVVTLNHRVFTAQPR